jgi:hypothetical protein
MPTFDSSGVKIFKVLFVPATDGYVKMEESKELLLAVLAIRYS